MDPKSNDSYVCNMCYRALDEVRFKCTCCIDYDVCQECLVQVEDRTHADHIFLKVTIGDCACGKDEASGNAKPVVTFADRLAVLDGLSIFKLDADNIAQQLRMPIAQVRMIMNEMLADEVNDHTASLVDECPMLIEEDDTEIATTSNVAACRNGFTITRGPEMYTLWDTLQAVANDDDVNVAVEMDLLEDWVTWRDTAKEYNMSALLRNNKIAATLLVTREPSIQKKVLKCSEAVVQGNTRLLSTKRKALTDALKKQSRSRTKAAAEDIAAYALEAHFTPDSVAAHRAKHHQRAATRARKSACKSSSKTANKARGKIKSHHRRKAVSRGSGVGFNAPAGDVVTIAESAPAACPSPTRNAPQCLGEDVEVPQSALDAEHDSSAHSDDAAAASDSSDDSDECADASDTQREHALQQQCEALLPTNMRSTRTMRREVVQLLVGAKSEDISVPKRAPISHSARGHTGRPRRQPRLPTDGSRILLASSTPAPIRRPCGRPRQRQNPVMAAISTPVGADRTSGAHSDDAAADSDGPDGSDISTDDSDYLREHAQQQQCEALLPTNMRSTRTMRREAVKRVTGAKCEDSSVTTLAASLASRTSSTTPRRKPRGRPRNHPVQVETSTAVAEVTSAGYLSDASFTTAASCPRLAPLSPHEEGLVQRQWAAEVSACFDSDSDGDRGEEAMDVEGEKESTALQCSPLPSDLQDDMCLCRNGKAFIAFTVFTQDAAVETPHFYPLVSQWMPWTLYVAALCGSHVLDQRRSPHCLLATPPTTPPARAVLTALLQQFMTLIRAVLDREVFVTSDRVEELVDDDSCVPQSHPTECCSADVQVQQCHKGLHTSAETLMAEQLMKIFCAAAAQPVKQLSFPTPAPLPLSLLSSLGCWPLVALPAALSAKPILKKRLFSDTDAAPADAAASKKSVHFDITASMTYKRWRVGKSEAFSVEAALLEMAPPAVSDPSEVHPPAILDDTAGVPEATGTQSTPSAAHAPHAAQPSILKKRPASAVSPDQSGSIVSAIATVAASASEASNSDGPAAKRVRFSEEVPAESKPRAGPYRSYKHRLAERNAKLAAQLVAMPTAGSASATPKPALERPANVFSEELHRDLSSSLGSFWSDYRSLKRERIELIGSASAPVVSPEISTASLHGIRAPAAPAASAPALRAPFWKPKLEQIHPQVDQGRIAVVRGEHDSDTESDSSGDSSVELNIALPQPCAEDGGETFREKSAIASVAAAPITPAPHCAGAPTVPSIDSSHCAPDSSTDSSAMPLEPCALSSLYEEFEVPTTHAAAPAHKDSADASAVVETQASVQAKDAKQGDENQDASNVCMEDESSPFFDDEPGLVVVGKSCVHAGEDDLLWQKNWVL